MTLIVSTSREIQWRRTDLAQALRNYIGFFTILWFTWLETSLFDVRFSSDSVFNRICKAISFGVMTGFAISGAIYDTTSPESVVENLKAFKAMAIILMVSRLALVAQYGVVLWYVKDFRQTFVPLAATIAVQFVAAMIFLGTFWGFPQDKGQESFPIESGGASTYIAWYVVVCVEALGIIAISCIWRVVSFKHTHLVERIGLLTLIIMGEGIIGLTKSVSAILQHSATVTSSDIGVIVGAVLLIYFIWVLYFDQIEHDRFGTIRQQIWAILHYPLHVAILLTVEGSSMLILWNVISKVDDLIWYWWPATAGDYNFGYWYNNTEQVIEYVNYGIRNVSYAFKNQDLLTAYQYNITQIRDAPYKFGTEKYDDYVGEICASIWFSMERVAFETFGVEVPESSSGKGEFAESAALLDVFNQVWVYFFIAAGTFLVVLAIMYWFGKTHKSRGEYFSIAVRVVAGIGLALGCLENWVDYTTSSANFVYSPWPLLTVMFGYLVVIVLDNLLVWHTNKTIARMTSNHKHDEYSLTGSLSRRGESAGGEGDRQLEQPPAEEV